MSSRSHLLKELNYKTIIHFPPALQPIAVLSVEPKNAMFLTQYVIININQLTCFRMATKVCIDEGRRVGAGDNGTGTGGVDSGRVGTGEVDSGGVGTGDVNSGRVDTGDVDSGGECTGGVDSGGVGTGDVATMESSLFECSDSCKGLSCCMGLLEWSRCSGGCDCGEV